MQKDIQVTQQERTFSTKLKWSFEAQTITWASTYESKFSFLNVWSWILQLCSEIWTRFQLSSHPNNYRRDKWMTQASHTLQRKTCLSPTTRKNIFIHVHAHSHIYISHSHTLTYKCSHSHLHFVSYLFRWPNMGEKSRHDQLNFPHKNGNSGVIPWQIRRCRGMCYLHQIS